MFDPSKTNKEDFEEDILDMLIFAATTYKLEQDKMNHMVLKAVSHALYIYNCICDKQFEIAMLLDGQDIAEDLLELVRVMSKGIDGLMEVNRQMQARQKDGDKSEDPEAMQESEDHKSEDTKTMNDNEDTTSEGFNMTRETEDNNSEYSKTMQDSEDTKSKGPERMQESEDVKTKQKEEGGVELGHYVCEFKGTHLSRHLKAKHPDQCMSSVEVSRLVALSDEKLEKRGQVVAPTKKGKTEYLYQCRFCGCSSIVKRMGQHLLQAHRLTDKEQIKKAREKFVCLDMPNRKKFKEQNKNKRKATKASSKCKASSSSSAQEPPKKTKKIAPKKKRKEEEDVRSSDDSDETDGTFVSDGVSDDDVTSYQGELQVEEDLDEMSDLVETDDEG